MLRQIVVSHERIHQPDSLCRRPVDIHIIRLSDYMRQRIGIVGVYNRVAVSIGEIQVFLFVDRKCRVVGHVTVERALYVEIIRP